MARSLARIPSPAALWVQKTAHVAPSAAGIGGMPGATGSPAGNPGQPANWPEALKALLKQTIALWGVSDDILRGSSGAWPATDEGLPDVPAVAARYQLSATLLQATTSGRYSSANRSWSLVRISHARSGPWIWPFGRLTLALASMLRTPSGAASRQIAVMSSAPRSGR